MAEPTINDIRYMTGRMNAFDQLHVARRIAPVLTGLGSVMASLMGGGNQINGTVPGGGEDVSNVSFYTSLGPLSEAVSKMSDQDVNYVIRKCLSAVRKYNGERWVPVLSTSGELMFENEMDMSVLLQLTMEVLSENIGPFLRGPLLQSSGAEESTSASTSSE
jgi:hypothetical protein